MRHLNFEFVSDFGFRISNFRFIRGGDWKKYVSFSFDL
ncbi:hypothetical protein D1AOALGA4SA_700 [Olavius algarvensis Delta 1 endosymbiont]|nr:hypothetical protein D1AOALGA4SA_700 [Olavius algarvensis Delta 1 endosymbiont]